MAYHFVTNFDGEISDGRAVDVNKKRRGRRWLSFLRRGRPGPPPGPACSYFGRTSGKSGRARHANIANGSDGTTIGATVADADRLLGVFAASYRTAQAVLGPGSVDGQRRRVAPQLRRRWWDPELRPRPRRFV